MDGNAPLLSLVTVSSKQKPFVKMIHRDNERPKNFKAVALFRAGRVFFLYILMKSSFALSLLPDFISSDRRLRSAAPTINRFQHLWFTWCFEIRTGCQLSYLHFAHVHTLLSLSLCVSCGLGKMSTCFYTVVFVLLHLRWPR